MWLSTVNVVVVPKLLSLVSVVVVPCRCVRGPVKLWWNMQWETFSTMWNTVTDSCHWLPLSPHPLYHRHGDPLLYSNSRCRKLHWSRLWNMQWVICYTMWNMRGNFLNSRITEPANYWWNSFKRHLLDMFFAWKGSWKVVTSHGSDVDMTEMYDLCITAHGGGDKFWTLWPMLCHFVQWGHPVASNQKRVRP